MLNSGNTPTEELVVAASCHESSNSPKTTDPFAYFSWGSSEKIPISIGPKQRIGFSVCQINEPEFPQIISHEIKKFIIGEVRYKDALNPGIQRITRIVRQIFIGKNSDISTRAVGMNNCTDKDCP